MRELEKKNKALLVPHLGLSKGICDTENSPSYFYIDQ